MARKPKAARSNEFAISVEEVLAVLGDAPAPPYQGRKPKAAASPEPPVMMDSDDAAGGTVDADGSVADPGAAPARKRPGPKPKQRAGEAEAAPPRTGAEAKPGLGARAPDADPEPMPVGDDLPSAERADGQGQAQGHEPAALATPDPAANDAASTGSSQAVATAAQPAAHWDRATGTVRFEWAEIERTAAQSGPNQAMAKLLVAARAEGANSRWPF